MQRYYYSYSEFLKDIKILSKEIKEFKPEAILAIARGGLTLGHFLSVSLDIRDIYTINSIYYNKDKKLDNIKIFNIPNLKDYKKVIIVDEIVDSGKTVDEVLKKLKKIYPDIQFKTASIFYKNNALVIPDFKIKEANRWIDFFWEVD